MKITNAGSCDLTLSSGTTIRKGETVDANQEDTAALANPVEAGWIASGMLTVQKASKAKRQDAAPKESTDDAVPDETDDAVPAQAEG